MSSKNYYPKGTNDTPCNPQLQHFDFICGQIINENRILKFVVVAAVLSFFLSIGICIYAVAQPDSIPVHRLQKLQPRLQPELLTSNQ